MFSLRSAEGSGLGDATSLLEELFTVGGPTGVQEIRVLVKDKRISWRGDSGATAIEFSTGSLSSKDMSRAATSSGHTAWRG